MGGYAMLQSHRLTNHIIQQISGTLESNHQEYLFEAGIDQHLMLQINGQLEVYQTSLTNQQWLFQSLEWQLMSIRNPQNVQTSAEEKGSIREFKWADMRSEQTATLWYAATFNWPGMIIRASLLALLVTGLGHLLLHVNWHAARHAVLHFLQHPNSYSNSLNILSGSHQLVFVPASQQLSINGIPANLSKTPYFYLLWYAMKRVENDNQGWVLNPPSDRHDQHNAQSLIALMESYGGHRRAINELKDKGLRAKTLDQNRNKIKEELLATYPEAVVQEVLFESKRDGISARYCYRLRINPTQITLINSTAEKM